MSQRPTIAILGAGPAGLTAATMLTRAGWQCSVFEADQSARSRDQGGSLDLHPNEGQLALKKAGLWDAFMQVARHEDQDQQSIDHASGAVLRREAPEPGMGERPEIDRIVLRELLLQPMPTTVVRWGQSVTAVVARADGRHELFGVAGSLGRFDLVIGADGAWSAARAALTDIRPHYTGITFVELWLTDVDRRHPEKARLVGHGTMFSLHGGAGIIAQRNGNALVRVYAAFRTTPEEGDRPDRTLASITKLALLARFEGWSPALLSLIADADSIAAVRPIVALPNPLGWPSRPGLTLLGDAAHVMPPLGVGVNLAMLDAAELAEALIGSTHWRDAVTLSERNMLARAEPLAASIGAAFQDMFSVQGEQILLDNMGSHPAD
ncbi:FAD-dependent monooxygenase [Robbsia sp. KACC 23696]|uniref:FAD-dependent oxidoreductase n=1 Tax=Robbsia sp. KACC 23696 TaxID=3149231 RepID=UPI00325AD77D